MRKLYDKIDQLEHEKAIAQLHDKIEGLQQDIAHIRKVWDGQEVDYITEGRLHAHWSVKGITKKCPCLVCREKREAK